MNAKNLLSVGITLAIVLFISVQMSAMELGRKVNPYLSEEEKAQIKRTIEMLQKEVEWYGDPKKATSKFPFVAEKKESLEYWKNVYYGNKPIHD